MSAIITYVTEEVWRQGHDVAEIDGISRVAGMLNAWCWAIEQDERFVVTQKPTVDDLRIIGGMIEKVNAPGFRTGGVTVGGRVCPRAEKVPSLLVDMFEGWQTLGDLPLPKDVALACYRELLMIHPFFDGNGRSGKVILNWLAGTLRDPFFPPNTFWGREIRNP